MLLLMNRSSHLPSDSAYYIEDCVISTPLTRSLEPQTQGDNGKGLILNGKFMTVSIRGPRIP